MYRGRQRGNQPNYPRRVFNQRMPLRDLEGELLMLITSEYQVKVGLNSYIHVQNKKMSTRFTVPKRGHSTTSTNGCAKTPSCTATFTIPRTVSSNFCKTTASTSISIRPRRMCFAGANCVLCRNVIRRRNLGTYIWLIIDWFYGFIVIWCGKWQTGKARLGQEIRRNHGRLWYLPGTKCPVAHCLSIWFGQRLLYPDGTFGENGPTGVRGFIGTIILQFSRKT